MLDANDKPVPNTDVKVTVFRGDAKFFRLKDGTDSASGEITEKTDKDGKLVLGVVSGPNTDVPLQANAVVVGSQPEIREPIDSGVSGKPLECEGLDCRHKTNFNFYTGFVIDSFASQAYNDKFNANVTSATKTSPIFGIDFGHRFATKGGKWWVYGETVHSSRTLEVQCNQGTPVAKATAVTPNADPDPPNTPCTRDANKQPTDANNYTALLRNASSTEAFIGIRWEPPGSLTENSTFYAKVQAGFLSVAGAGGDVIDNHILPGVGIMLTKGKLQDSYIEVGHGQTDLFVDHRKNRWKFDGYLSWDPSGDNAQSLLTPFLQMTVDSDFKKGADSVQIYVGMNVSLDSMKITFGQ